MTIRIEPVRMQKSGDDNKKSIEVAPGVHAHASVSVRKLEKRIVRLTAQAITDYGMIVDGDKVMVAMSGGKDSYTLLETLIKLQKRAPIRFEILAVHIDQHIPGSDPKAIADFLQQTGIPYHIEDQDTHSIITRLIPEEKNICSLCARLRRGILYRVAREHHCTKIALGHQMDDVVSTLLLNMFYGGRIKAMPPVLRSDDKANVVIRPMIYLREKEIERWAKVRSYPLAPKKLCGAAENKQRAAIKELMQQWDREDDSRIYNLLMSTTRVAASQLADKTLFDFGKFARLGESQAPQDDQPKKKSPTSLALFDAEKETGTEKDPFSWLTKFNPWRTPY